MRIDLTDLNLFLNTVECGSITAGAERSHMALASASARIRALEQDWKVALLERHPRGVSPTSAGETLARHARLVLRQIEQMKDEMGFHSQGGWPWIRLLANTAANAELLPDVLSGFLAANPGVSIDVLEKPSFEIIELVAAGHADFGVMSDAEACDALETLPLCADHLVLLAPMDNEFGVRQAVPFRDIVNLEGFVGLSARNALERYLTQRAAQHGTRMNYRVRFDGFPAMCKAVADGVGFAIVPESIARAHSASRCSIIPISDPWARRNLALCAKRFADLPDQARRLAKSFEAFCGREAATQSTETESR